MAGQSNQQEDSPINSEFWNSPEFTEKVKSLAPAHRQPVPLEVMIKLRTENHLSYQQIAKLVGYSKRWVIFKLSNIDADGVKTYTDNRPIYFQSLQHRLLSSITDDDIKKTPVGSRVLAAAQIYDKERLETDKSTQNQAVQIMDPGIRALASRCKGKYKKPAIPTITECTKHDNE